MKKYRFEPFFEDELTEDEYFAIKEMFKSEGWKVFMKAKMERRDRDLTIATNVGNKMCDRDAACGSIACTAEDDLMAQTIDTAYELDEKDS